MGRQRGGQQKCWRCGLKGHVQTECLQLSGFDEAKEGCGKCCFLCGSPGHLSANCVLFTKVEERPWPRIKQVISGREKSGEREGICSKHRMSVLVTTSPVPSNPSTMMLEAVLNSFARVEGLRECPLVIVCDGHNLASKSTWKAGRVTEDAAERYDEYLRNLEALLDTGVLPPSTRLVQLEGRNGQALALKAGLAQVETRYICVHQHDLEFAFDFGLDRVLDILEDESNYVKYIGMPLLVNLHYEAIAWQHHSVRVTPEAHGDLQLVPIVFWYDSTHITSISQYISVVFGPEEAYTPGNFIEETFGIRQRNDIMTNGMAAHARYGTYHYLSHPSPPERRPVICHLNGVRFLTPEQRAERGYPSDPPVEFFASRTMTSRRQRRIKHILDTIAGLADTNKAQAAEVRDVLSKLINETRIRCSRPASECLPALTA